MDFPLSLQSPQVPRRCVPDTFLCRTSQLMDCFPQPLMSLMFGDLIQDFFKFSIAIQSIDRNDPQSSSLIEEAARNFRHVAAKDASYLAYIGTWIPIAFASHRCHPES